MSKLIFSKIALPPATPVSGKSVIYIGTDGLPRVLGSDGIPHLMSISGLDGLSDTNLGVLASGHSLSFNGTEWVNSFAQPSGYQVPSGNYATISQGNTLWKSATDFFQPSGYQVPSGNYSTVGQGHELWQASGVAGVTTLANLTDTSINSATSGVLLAYDGTNWNPGYDIKILGSGVIQEGLTIGETLGNTSYLTLKGKNISGPSRRGGTIEWYSSNDDLVGYSWGNNNGRLVFDSGIQTANADNGNAWIEFATGDASFNVLSGTAIFHNGEEIGNKYVAVAGDTMTGNLTLNSGLLFQSGVIQSNSLNLSNDESAFVIRHNAIQDFADADSGNPGLCELSQKWTLTDSVGTEHTWARMSPYMSHGYTGNSGPGLIFTLNNDGSLPLDTGGSEFCAFGFVPASDMTSFNGMSMRSVDTLEFIVGGSTAFTASANGLQVNSLLDTKNSASFHIDMRYGVTGSNTETGWCSRRDTVDPATFGTNHRLFHFDEYVTGPGQHSIFNIWSSDSVGGSFEPMVGISGNVKLGFNDDGSSTGRSTTFMQYDNAALTTTLDGTVTESVSTSGRLIPVLTTRTADVQHSTSGTGGFTEGILKWDTNTGTVLRSGGFSLQKVNSAASQAAVHSNGEYDEEFLFGYNTIPGGTTQHDLSEHCFNTKFESAYMNLSNVELFEYNWNYRTRDGFHFRPYGLEISNDVASGITASGTHQWNAYAPDRDGNGDPHLRIRNTGEVTFSRRMTGEVAMDQNDITSAGRYALFVRNTVDLTMSGEISGTVGATQNNLIWDSAQDDATLPHGMVASYNVLDWNSTGDNQAATGQVGPLWARMVFDATATGQTISAANGLRIDVRHEGGTMPTLNEWAGINLQGPTGSFAANNIFGIRIHDQKSSGPLANEAIRIQPQTGGANKGNIRFHGGNYDNGHMVFDDLHVWLDESGQTLRGKVGAPTSDSDGADLMVDELSELTDVSVSTVTSGQQMTYDGTNWVPGIPRGITLPAVAPSGNNWFVLSSGVGYNEELYMSMQISGGSNTWVLIKSA